ncbi:23S rRNA (guanosine(2251)-2'-O)-methyltransferase RlmB [Candidatus Dojkabacteria bacterium]|nr:23S rRNA (guanosine(2251)-2'-O)-methyltransferase RlmB [Candidatus Dojkabacteria bacterium]
MQIEGRNPVTEALKSDRKISVIYIQNTTTGSDKIREIISMANKKGIRIRKIGKNHLAKITKTKNHQGIIASVRYEFNSLRDILEKQYAENKDPFFVLINEVLYQHNLGAIIRTAECAGCSGVIIPKKTQLTENAIRTSMGATEHIPVIKENLFNAMKLLKAEGIRIIALEATGKETIYDENLKGPVAIVIGGEHSGVTKSILPKCDKVLRIPLLGKINSLNMSNAAAIILFEKVRQEIVKSKD